jgi:hypothetical protein
MAFAGMKPGIPAGLRCTESMVVVVARFWLLALVAAPGEADLQYFPVVADEPSIAVVAFAIVNRPSEAVAAHRGRHAVAHLSPGCARAALLRLSINEPRFGVQCADSGGNDEIHELQAPISIGTYGVF